MFSGTQFVHPVRRGTWGCPKPAGETQHGHCARRLACGSWCAFLTLQPLQQLTGVLLVQPLHFFNDHFDRAHGWTLTLARTVTIANRSMVACCLPDSSPSGLSWDLRAGSRDSKLRVPWRLGRLRRSGQPGGAYESRWHPCHDVFPRCCGDEFQSAPPSRCA